MLVREMMNSSVVSLQPDDTVATARDRLRSRQVMHGLVIQAEVVVGVLAFRDLAGKSNDTPVSEVMSREVSSIDAESSLRKAASLMIRSTTGCLPVMQAGKVAGIITTTELMRVLNADSTLS